MWQRWLVAWKAQRHAPQVEESSFTFLARVAPKSVTQSTSSAMDPSAKNAQAHLTLLRNVASELVTMETDERKDFERDHAGPLGFLRAAAQTNSVSLTDIAIRGMLIREFPELEGAHGGHLLTVIWSYALLHPNDAIHVTK
jgi:hypothetical protein